MERTAGDGPVLVLSGPEGGLSAQEERIALAQGFTPVSLGARYLTIRVPRIGGCSSQKYGSSPLPRATWRPL